MLKEGRTKVAGADGTGFARFNNAIVILLVQYMLPADMKTILEGRTLSLADERFRREHLPD
jgi:hypothetical protein